MHTETERKFLVSGSYKHLARSSAHIVQAYICRGAGNNVRVRIYGERAFLTIKTKSRNAGLSRYEWEKEITLADAVDLLKICEAGIVEKTRYLVDYKGKTFEIDEFTGENAGLVMAEIELDSEDEMFEKPDFLGAEVTGDSRYYNSFLSKIPYSKW